MAEKKINPDNIDVKKGDIIQVTDVGNDNTDKPHTFKTTVLNIVDDKRVAIEYKGKKVNAIWSRREKWLVATYYTDMAIYEGGQYETGEIKYDSEEANKESEEIDRELVEAARKRGQEKT